nr:alpha/beta hydrolase [Sphingomonas sp. Y57]
MIRDNRRLLAGVLLLVIGSSVQAEPEPASDRKGYANISDHQMMDWLPRTQPTARLRYADDSPLQFGDLRIPANAPPPAGHPVIIFLHGGGWMSDWNKDYSDALVENLSREGFAPWSVEYRRLGNAGGGFPRTFLDVSRAADFVEALSGKYPLDLDRVIVVGHSAGGHLALWLAGRRNVPPASVIAPSKPPLRLRGAVVVASVSSLEDALEKSGRQSTLSILGATTLEEARRRYAEASPDRLLPLDGRLRVIDGSKDAEWRIASNTLFAERARAAGNDVGRIILQGANHFDVVTPSGPAFAAILRAVKEIDDGEPDR